MDTDDLLQRLPAVPFRLHGADLYGMDCFGLVEFWHKEILGIRISDRCDHPSEPSGFFAGYEAQEDWIDAEPTNHSVAVMRTIQGRKVLDFGHCGMIWNGRVYHFTPDYGFQHSDINDRQLRITKIMKHRLCTVS